MLHTKFHGNPSASSREEDFCRVFTMYGRLQTSWSMWPASCHQIFISLYLKAYNIKFGFDWPSGFWEKQVLSFVCKWPWAKVKKWPWPSILTYVHFFSWFQVTGCKCFEKSTVFTFSLQKSLCDQIWPCRKIGQGQPRVMIYIHFLVLHTLMLHAKFQGNWPSGSGEGRFF